MRMIKNNIEKFTGGEGQELKLGQEEIKNEAFNHFKKLLTAPDSHVNLEDFLRHIPKTIDKSINISLTKEVTEEEVKAAI